MIFQKAFYKTIDLLETYYDNHKQDDAIITILSDLDCTIFEDWKPIGQAVYTDIYENNLRYNYIISPDLYIIFGLTNNILSGLEIITDENLINEIVNARKPDAI